MILLTNEAVQLNRKRCCRKKHSLTGPSMGRSCLDDRKMKRELPVEWEKVQMEGQ